MPAFFHLEHRVSSVIEGSDSSKTKHQPYLPAALPVAERKRTGAKWTSATPIEGQKFHETAFKCGDEVKMSHL